MSVRVTREDSRGTNDDGRDDGESRGDPEGTTRLSGAFGESSDDLGEGVGTNERSNLSDGGHETVHPTADTGRERLGGEESKAVSWSSLSETAR